MKIELCVLLVSLIYLPKVELEAPGDADSSCTNFHTSPRNYQVLLDSFLYVTLLQGQSSLWQEVDVDGVTDFSKSDTTWTQDGDHRCRQAMWSCHFYVPTQNNWLITQHISRLVDGTLLLQVIAQIEFEVVMLCGDGCQKSFVLEVWETSSISRIQARNTSQYRRVGIIMPNQASVHEPQNVSIPINFQTNATGFYLALVDKNTCIAITRVLVFYYSCPATTRNFRSYPETPSPPIVDRPVPTVTRGCVGGELTLTCAERGMWREVIAEEGCQCLGSAQCTAEIQDSRKLSPATSHGSNLRSENILIIASKTTIGPVITDRVSVSHGFKDSTSLQSGAARVTESQLVAYTALSAAVGILFVALLFISIRIHHRTVIQQDVNIDEEENVYQEISNYQVRPPSPYIQQDENPSYGVPLVIIKRCEEVSSPKKSSAEYLEVF